MARDLPSARGPAIHPPGLRLGVGRHGAAAVTVQLAASPSHGLTDSESEIVRRDTSSSNSCVARGPSPSHSRTAQG